MISVRTPWFFPVFALTEVVILNFLIARDFQTQQIVAVAPLENIKWENSIAENMESHFVFTGSTIVTPMRTKELSSSTVMIAFLIKKSIQWFSATVLDA